MDYAHDGDALCYARPVGGDTLTFRAEVIHQERTGVHARVAIGYHGVELAWSTFNVERDEDRVRLSNSAHKHLNGQTAEYPATYLKNDLDKFCRGLWDAHVGDLEGGPVAGTAEPTPVRFALMPYLVEGGGTIVFAHPGRGKSYLTGLMAVTLDAGTEIKAEQRLWPVRQQRVLFINLERSELSVQNRLGNINAALGLPRPRKLVMMNQRGRSLAEIAEAARRTIRRYDCQTVVLDSISRAGIGDLTDNQPVNRIIDLLNGLAPTGLAIAHAPRGSEEHVFGGIHFDAGADVVVRVLAEQEEGGPLGLGLQVTKENDIGKQPLQSLALEFNGPLGLCGVRPANKGEFPEIERGRPMSMKRAAIDYLLGVGDATASQVAEATAGNRANISHLLANDAAFVRTRKLGREQFYGVIGLP
jgi:hypothetical protein